MMTRAGWPMEDRLLPFQVCDSLLTIRMAQMATDDTEINRDSMASIADGANGTNRTNGTNVVNGTTMANLVNTAKQEKARKHRRAGNLLGGGSFYQHGRDGAFGLTAVTSLFGRASAGNRRLLVRQRPLQLLL